MEKEILEGNKLIAEFMETKERENRYFHESSEYVFEACELEYHSSWDWLMPVLTKIGNDTGHELVIHSETSYWNQFGDNALATGFLGYGYPLQDGIWKAIVGFIEWYNENN